MRPGLPEIGLRVERPFGLRLDVTRIDGKLDVRLRAVGRRVGVHRAGNQPQEEPRDPTELHYQQKHEIKIELSGGRQRRWAGQGRNTRRGSQRGHPQHHTNNARTGQDMMQKILNPFSRDRDVGGLAEVVPSVPLLGADDVLRQPSKIAICAASLRRAHWDPLGTNQPKGIIISPIMVHIADPRF
ncbi:hypothetical protein NUU61_004529 [Penicillium alfredii]|uniref:Uncharacterized protein n=1 Tax=Penicillium alfredii TaxID=1506179 RepID=A0A9W9FLS6_9EURO|nr:uncharacterized protein NUU61_004529 [Penicillium alfredii]KAJ5102307.1 hypothetical protein NUU61_004529 [Penicillium alfredii]